MNPKTPDEIPNNADRRILPKDASAPSSPLASSARVHERRTLVLKLRQSGVQTDSIVRAVMQSGLGSESYGAASVSKDIHEALETYRSQSRDIVRDMQLIEGMRLDDMWFRSAPRIATGDPAAIACGVQISKQRTFLFGLNQDFQESVAEQVKAEVSGVLDLLQIQLTPTAYREVLMAISGRNNGHLDDRLETIDVKGE